MTEHELFHKTFSPLHASPDTLMEVQKTMENSKKTRRALSRGAVIAIAAALTLTVAVAAGVVTLIRADVSPADEVDDTTHHAFTDDIDAATPLVEDGKGNYITVADMERIPGDPAETERLVGDYLSKLDASLTVEGNTYKMGTFLVDETGSGILTFSIENPDGFTYGDMGYGETWVDSVRADLSFGRSAPEDPNGQDSGYHFADMKLYADESTSTDTCLQMVAYFITGKGYETGTNFYFTVRDEAYQPYSIAIQPRVYLPVKTLTAANGETLTLSPLGMTVVDTLHSDTELGMDELLIHYQDGADFAVDSVSRNLRNWVVGLISGGRATADALQDLLGITDLPEGIHYSYVFNRLVDVDAVTSVTLEGRAFDFTTEQTAPVQQTYLP